jgi:hypothetical protein
MAPHEYLRLQAKDRSRAFARLTCTTCTCAQRYARAAGVRMRGKHRYACAASDSQTSVHLPSPTAAAPRGGSVHDDAVRVNRCQHCACCKWSPSLLFDDAKEWKAITEAVKILVTTGIRICNLSRRVRERVRICAFQRNCVDDGHHLSCSDRNCRYPRSSRPGFCLRRWFCCRSRP